MGVLMLNDINYSGGGGAEEMTLAQYNALSQAEKNDGKIRFITDVDGQGTWKLLGTTTGTTAINLPSSFNEVLVCVKLGTNNVKVNLLIPYLDLTTSSMQYRSGYAAASTSMAHIAIDANRTSLKLSGANFNSTDIVSSCTMNVYYR